MSYSSLLRYALVGAFVLSSSLVQAQQLAPEEAEALGVSPVLERPTPAPATERGGLQVCVDDVLLIADSGIDGVAVHDPTTGDLVDGAFIVDPTNLSTPKNAIGNFDGDGVFVIDQLSDAIFEYDCDGNFKNLFAPAGGVDTAILDNAIGITISPDGTELWATVTGGANQDAVARFDTNGNYLGNIVANGAGGVDGPFDVLLRSSDMLVPAINTDDIHRYDLSGTFLGIFQDAGSALNFPEQANLASNGNVLVAGFITTPGIYEYDGTTGAEVGVYTAGLNLFRGVYELPNGNLLVTAGSATSEITRSNTLVRTFGTANQYIELFEAPGGDPIKTSCSGPASVPQGGQATFMYQVCNNTDQTQSGVTFFNVFRDSMLVRGPRQLAMGSIQPMSCTPTLSFTVNAPNAAPVDDYDVSINALPDGISVSECVVSVAVTANARPDGAATAWSLVDAQPWPALEAAAATAEIGVFPNPFRGQTTIQYDVAESSEVRLVVYDMLGRTIAVLAEGRVEAGTHAATFDARGLSAGTYVYRLQVGDTVQTGRLTVLY